MMLRAAFVPPEEAVEQLRALGGRLAQLPGISAVGPGRVDVPIAGLGNVVEADASRFAGVLAECLSDIPPVAVRAAGVELAGEEVTVRLDGDVATLAAVARAVGTAAERVNVYIDRRGFRPAVVVGSVASTRPGSPLDRMLSGPGVLCGLAMEPWPVAEVALIRTRWFGGEARAETAYRIPFRAESFVGRDFRTAKASTPLE
ncbi:2'-5' RNA ligase family protein [Nocardioides albidus]|uniref:2'-5' RNA ligase family protein n=1 Tax=Nocardioides albidus TaxID=1517589 RepID=A0A5C4VPQ4_9ACTN|nr:2'-5' RNA ligase family protein [Nocardioides albidus]TNM37319.1 2'-5' RNA ligase family protein [Nocardioides albidus]